MKQLLMILFSMILMLGTVTASEKIETEEIKKTIRKAIEAMYNEVDAEAVRKYYHPGYLLFVNQNIAVGNILLILNREQRITLKQKSYSQSKPEDWPKATIEFVSVEIFGTAATARFHYYLNGKQTCEDFMSLYKYEYGWRIISQTTYHLPQQK